VMARTPYTDQLEERLDRDAIRIAALETYLSEIYRVAEANGMIRFDGLGLRELRILIDGKPDAR